MKLFLIVGALASVAFAIPVDPDSEVEFVRPTNTNDGPPEGTGGGPRFPFPGGFGGGDEEGGDGFIPVIIVRRVGGGDVEGEPGVGLPSGFPFGGSGGGGGLDLRGLLDMFFGGDGSGPGAGFIPTIGDGGDGDVIIDGEGEAPPPPCGLLCTMLREFQTRIDQVEHEIRDIQQTKEDEQNEIEGTGTGSGSDEEDDDDKYDQTYEEKVLPDGTVVRINRTSFSDTSDDGSSFFFHSTAIHNIGDGGTDVNGDEDSDNGNEDSDETYVYADDEVESLPDKSEKLSERRRRRSPQDGFFGQQEQQIYFPVANDLQQPRSRQEFGQLVVAPPGAVSFGDDTRVNDLLTESANRGSLIAIEPESEFVTRDQNGNIVPARDGQEQRTAFPDSVRQRPGQLRFPEEASGSTQEASAVNPWAQQTVVPYPVVPGIIQPAYAGR